LERLRIDDPSFLTTPFCKHLTSLQCLQLGDRYDYEIDEAGLTCEQEAALQLLTSLQELRFHRCSELSDLPVGLHSLPSLKQLEIFGCPNISDLPVGLHSLPSLKQLEIFGCPNISRLPRRSLPPSLEELVVCYCSKELTEQCRMLVTSKLKVIINWNYVN
jgi:hypothetical protein